MNQLLEALIQQAIEDYRAGLPDAVLFLQQAGVLGPEGIDEQILSRLHNSAPQH